jgi:hypothetical protein
VPLPNYASPRSSSAATSKTPTASRQTGYGSIPASSSPPATAPRWNRETSAAASTAASGRTRTEDHRARNRKTCRSLLAALDVHPRVAMQILGHSKIAVTMEIYAI